MVTILPEVSGKMNSNHIYSKELLKNMPEVYRDEKIMYLLNYSFQPILRLAKEGKTSYTVNLDINEQGTKRNIDLTIDEIISGVQKIFPGCKITYEEVWFDINSTTKNLRKGIRIDWS